MSNIEYLPPSDKTLDKFAQNVCRQLSKDDEGFKAIDVMVGLAGYLKFVAKNYADSLNQGQKGFDNNAA